MRKPIVAGQFYDDNLNSLNKQIECCFFHKLGPGNLPIKRSNRKLIGIVAPHAGYVFSGPCQAWAYKEIAESRFPLTFVIFGVNHSGYGNNYSISLQDWETPFGIVKVDKAFGNSLIKKCDLVKNDESSHGYEHSIEVQLPFLQFVNKDLLNKIKILPLSISDYNYEECKIIAEEISKNKDIMVIASSDFTHFGPNYGYMPFKHNIKEEIYNLDGKLIEFINNLNAEEFLSYKDKKRATICGAGPITLLIETVKRLGAKRGNLLKYYTSGDLTNYENAVGYAALSFK